MRADVVAVKTMEDRAILEMVISVAEYAAQLAREKLEDLDSDIQEEVAKPRRRPNDTTLRPDGRMTPQTYILPLPGAASWRVLKGHIAAGYFPKFAVERSRTRWWNTSDMERWQAWKCVPGKEHRETYLKWVAWHKKNKPKHKDRFR